MTNGPTVLPSPAARPPSISPCSLLGVGRGDRVLVSSLTFSATAQCDPLRRGRAGLHRQHRGRAGTWIPDLLAEALRALASTAACVPVDIYGQCADYVRDRAASAPSTGCRWSPMPPRPSAPPTGAEPAGSFGAMAALSFNGNKIITTSGGGALVTDDADMGRQGPLAGDPGPGPGASLPALDHRLQLPALQSPGRPGPVATRRPDRRVDIRRGAQQLLSGGARRPAGSRRSCPRRPATDRRSGSLTFTIDPAISRGRPGGDPPPSRIARHRGTAGVEADAPPAGLRRLPGLWWRSVAHGSSSMACAYPAAHP